MSCPVMHQTSESSATPPSSCPFMPIPQPSTHLFGMLGNLPDVDPSFPLRNIWKMQDLYGPIMKLAMPEERIFLASREYVNEISDETRFRKVPPRTLKETRALLGDGLFTAYEEEPNWGKAHRLLIPAFGPLGVRRMFDDMLDISSQMVLKWDRLGPDHAIDCSDDFTRLAFDTIGLCAFSYRFNEFYQEHVHPFAKAMTEVLLESGKRASRPEFTRPLYYRSEQKRQEHVRSMHKLCDEIVADRKKHPQAARHDLLDVMLNSTDRETGEKLSDENIRFQMATFLVAGHETTSGTLSFTWYNLLKHPDTYLKAQQQVDEVIGDDALTLEHLPKLTYIDACVKETLRLNGPIGNWSVSAREETTLAGKYHVPKEQSLSANLKGFQQDPLVFGEDAALFRPERMLNGGFQALPPNSWKPFGNGSRACIGRGFAEQEMLMNIALTLQRFQVDFVDPSYELKLKATLTTKPESMFLKVHRRPGKSINVGIASSGHAAEAAMKSHKSHDQDTSLAGDKKALDIFFAGNTGTCESLAQSLESAAADRGMKATIRSLDAATERLPTQHPAVFIASSYEGQPPDNAKKFVSWLVKLDTQSQKQDAVKYAVFGVGNSDWASTFHRIPKLVDDLLAKAGATRIVEPGFSNVKVDPVGPWEEWSEGLLDALSGATKGATDHQESSLELSIQKSKMDQAFGDEEAKIGTVTANYELVGTEVGPAKRHLDIRLPEDTHYLAGDYLVVQPRNPEATVHRVLRRFDLSPGDSISIKNSSKKFLPKDPTAVAEFLTAAIELNTPITNRQLQVLIFHASTAEDKLALERLDSQLLLEKRYSVLDLLEEHPHHPLPFSKYVDMLPPLSPRQYSIASSSLKDPSIASLCIDVHSAPALSGHGTFNGVTSSYLATRLVGDHISCFVRPTNVGFRVPKNTETPVLMMCAGTGIAPMRAFLQERAALKEAGIHTLGPAILYYGCRDSDRDFLYKHELRAWQDQGIVKVRTAFSRSGDAQHHYVPDLIYEDREVCGKLFMEGGKIFVCGSAARLGKGVEEVCKQIRRERSGCSEEEAEEWLRGVRFERFVADVY